MGTPCSVQVLDADDEIVQPFSDFLLDVTPGRIEEPGSVEPFDIALSVGQTSASYVFATQKSSDRWSIDAHLENVTDATTQQIDWLIIARSRTGFTVQFGALPETGNTHFRGVIRDTAASAASPAATDGQVYILELPFVTSLTGGGLSALDGVLPNEFGLTIGRMVALNIGGNIQFRRLTTGAPSGTDVAVAGNPSLRWVLSDLSTAQVSNFVEWANVGNKPTALSQFTNDVPFVTTSAQTTALAGKASVSEPIAATHAGRSDNPHAVTKAQVGLGNADNTSDVNKPVSTAQAGAIAAALAGKADVAEPIAATHLGRTDNPHNVTKTQVGLGSVSNDAQVKRTEMGAANGVAVLDVNTELPFVHVAGGVARSVDAKLRERLTSRDFGAIGDGTSHPLNTITSFDGTNTTGWTLTQWLTKFPTAAALTDEIDGLAIQKHVSFAITVGLTVYVGAGKFLTSQPIHLGYGVAYSTVKFIGEGYCYRGNESNGLLGTVLLPQFSNAPAIAVSAGKGTIIDGVSIVGPFVNYVNNQGFCGDTAPLSDDTVAANWADPSLDANFDSRYAPSAGIAIDPYAGTQPATHYPDVTFPASMGVVAQYGKNLGSSHVQIWNCYIAGFAAGVVNQPSDFDANGDHTKILSSYIERCKWAVSVCNSQSRNFVIRDTPIVYCYRGLTTDTHGRQVGTLQDEINVSFFRMIGLFKLGNYNGKPLVLKNCKAESTWTIGTIAAGASNEPSVIFLGGNIGLSLQDPNVRGIPPTCMDAGSIPSPALMNVEFIGTLFRHFPSVLSMPLNGARYTAGVSLETDSARANPYEKIAHNALAGGLVTYLLGRNRNDRIRSSLYDTSSGTSTSAFYGTQQAKTTRNFGVSIYTDEALSPLDTDTPPVRMPTLVFPISKTSSSIASASISGRTLTLTFTARAAATFGLNGPNPGDVIVDDQTNTTFFVRSVVGQVVLADMQNNYKSDGLGGYTAMTAVSTSTGTWYIANCRAYVPSHYLRADTQAGSAVLTNVARDDGFATFTGVSTIGGGVTTAGDLVAGDWVHVSDKTDRWVSPGNILINAVDQGAQTITLSGSAARADSRRRLAVFYRQPPANV